MGKVRESPKFRLISKIVFYVCAVLYPLMVFYLLVIRKTPIRMLSLFVMAFALLVFITGTSRPGSMARGQAVPGATSRDVKKKLN